jgi:hypothetical protein
MNKIVSRSPTATMLIAAKSVIPALRYDTLTAIWEKMFDAAQSPELSDHALSRNTDPATSRKAAEKADLRLNESRMTVLKFAIMRDPQGGFIDDDLRRTYANGETLRKRRSDLTDAGYIMAVDGSTRANRSGNLEQVWTITHKGRAAV